MSNDRSDSRNQRISDGAAASPDGAAGSAGGAVASPDGAVALQRGAVASPAGTVAHLFAREVDAALRRALGELQRAEQNAVLCFAQMVQRKLYLELGYATIHQYAAEALGFSQNRTYRFLRLAEDLERLPRLREAVAAGEIGWTKAREVVKVASPRTEAQWLEMARQTGRRELEGMVARARKVRAARRSSNPGQATLAVVASFAPGAECSVAPVAAKPRAEDSLIDDSLVDASLVDASLVDDSLVDDSLVDDSPAAVVFRLAPLQLARYEALMERIRKARVLAPTLSREELLLEALGQLLDSFEAQLADRDAGAGADHGLAADHGHGVDARQGADGGLAADDGHAADAGHGAQGGAGAHRHARPGAGPESTGSTGWTGQGAAEKIHKSLLPRGKSVIPYRIIIYQCDTCRRGFVQTTRGEKSVKPAELEAAGCDAIIARPGARNEATIPPSVRAAVLARDRHRCRARGCGATQFLEVHHVVPRSAGGSNRAENLVTLCSRCHQMWHERGLGALALIPHPLPV